MRCLNKKIIKIIAFIAILSIAILSSGCVKTDEDNVQGELPTGEDNDAVDEITDMVQPITSSYSENDSQNTVYAIKGDAIIVKLAENPTTGYSWNLTNSNGLELTEDNYEQKAGTDKLVGVGGIHQWIFEVTDRGEQNISAVYMRPWEEKTGAEDTFKLNVMALNEDELIKGTGTITYLELEGGFYGIIAADDSHYDPINLAEQFQNDGIMVEFVAYPRDDLMSFHMWGQLIEIRTIAVE
jgi:inhibitor of cysteine peptidase